MEAQKEVYFLKRGYSINPKNNLQKAFQEAVGEWDHYMVDSIEDFRHYAQSAANHCHTRHPRCRPLVVKQPYPLPGGRGRKAIWVDEFMCFELYPVVGRWTKKGGFQLIAQLIISQEL